ncbi:MAG: hypothetical protein MZV70_37590 [Desulfobacterales bacterium]|nr:hypothetical protein [Desulfobacterales bacterium]
MLNGACLGCGSGRGVFGCPGPESRAPRRDRATVPQAERDAAGVRDPPTAPSPSTF